MQWVKSAKPNTSYALCAHDIITDMKGGFNSAVIVPPEEQQWQDVCATTVFSLVTVLLLVGRPIEECTTQS